MMSDCTETNKTPAAVVAIDVSVFETVEPVSLQDKIAKELQLLRERLEKSRVALSE